MSIPKSNHMEFDNFYVYMNGISLRAFTQMLMISLMKYDTIQQQLHSLFTAHYFLIRLIMVN
ncbi:unnamed protein product [Prunus brigantina]